MDDSGKTKKQLLAELTDLRARFEGAAEAAVQASGESRYESLFNRAPLGIFISTLSGQYSSVNSTMAKMHGYAHPEEFTQDVHNIREDLWLDKASHDEFKRILLDNGEVTNFESPRRKRDGAIFWVSVSARLTNDPILGEGTIEGFIADITERKLASASLLEKTAILEAQVNATLDGILIVNEKQRILLVNQRFGDLFNVPPSILNSDDDAVLLRHVTSLAKDEQAFTSKVARLYRDSEATGRDEIEFKNGMVLDRYSAPVLGKEGKCYGRIWIFRDITERKRMQEMMVQTEKMMSLGGLAAGMAHEINNPLGGVLQNVQVLLRRLTQDNPVNTREAQRVNCPFEAIRAFMDNRGILDGLENIRESGVRAARIVSSMLEFSRHGEPSSRPVDLNALLDKAVSLCATDFDLKKRYDFRSVLIRRDYDPGLPLVPCSANQIEQAVMNLLRNAAQAMTERPPHAPPPAIDLRTRREGGHVRLEIEDNGPGMDEQTRRKAFDPFFTTKPVGEGTGLGLSITYFIITNNHHGTIEVSSQPGAGTIFIIRLPLDA